MDRSQAQHWRHHLLPELLKFVPAFYKATNSRLFSSCNEKGNRCKLALQIRFISKIFGLTFCNYHEKLKSLRGKMQDANIRSGAASRILMKCLLSGPQRIPIHNS